jgi:hypothetical protein
MRGDCLEKGLVPSEVKSTDFESGRLTGAPGCNGFRTDSFKGLALELKVPSPLDCILSGVSRRIDSEKPEELDCTETLGAPMKWSCTEAK